MTIFLANSLRAQCLRSFSARTMSSASVPLVLSPTQVHALTLSKENSVRLLDVTWFMPNSPRNASEEFKLRRLPGAQFLDIDHVASAHHLGLKHMMPTQRVFADACEKFGITPASHVILYDTHGIFSSPRALFMFRSFGHENSSIIDGGLPLWRLEGLPTEEGLLSHVEKSTYPTPTLNTKAIRSRWTIIFPDAGPFNFTDYEQIVSNSALDPDVDSGAELVLDARSRGRYLGKDPEPRPGISSGHIPRSLSLPFNLFLRKQVGDDGTEYTTMLPPFELRKVLDASIGTERAKLVVKGEMPVVTSCGSGMTAGILWLGLKLLGVDRIGLYDESWTGYAMRSTSKVEKLT